MRYQIQFTSNLGSIGTFCGTLYRFYSSLNFEESPLTRHPERSELNSLYFFRKCPLVR